MPFECLSDTKEPERDKTCKSNMIQEWDGLTEAMKLIKVRRYIFFPENPVQSFLIKPHNFHMWKLLVSC